MTRLPVLTSDAARALSSQAILELLAAHGLIVAPAVEGGWLWVLHVSHMEPCFLGPEQTFMTAAAALADGLDALLDRRQTPAVSSSTTRGATAAIASTRDATRKAPGAIAENSEGTDG